MVGFILDVSFLLLAVILSGPHGKPRRNKDWVTEKRTNLCEGHHIFDCTPSFLCHFVLLSWSTPYPFPSDVLDKWLLEKYIIWGHSKSMFAQDSLVLTPRHPLFALVHFRAPPPPPPPPKARLFWLELSSSISILVKFRENKLMMSTSIFGRTQRVF